MQALVVDTEVSMDDLELRRIARFVFRPISLQELHYVHPRDEARRDFIDSVHDSRKNAANTKPGA